MQCLLTYTHYPCVFKTHEYAHWHEKAQTQCGYFEKPVFYCKNDMPRYRILDQHGLNYGTCTVVVWVDVFTLSTITQPAYEIGRETVTILFDLIKKRKSLAN